MYIKLHTYRLYKTDRNAKLKMPLNDRICKLCTDSVIEDEMHFLLRCDFYPDLRRSLFSKAQLCIWIFYEISLLDKFNFVMKYVNMQHI